MDPVQWRERTEITYNRDGSVRGVMDRVYQGYDINDRFVLDKEMVTPLDVEAARVLFGDSAALLRQIDELLAEQTAAQAAAEQAVTAAVSERNTVRAQHDALAANVVLAAQEVEAERAKLAAMIQTLTARISELEAGK